MPEKKNIIPLLAIAFVVAIVCTGVFYGLFVGRLRSSASAASPAVLVAVRQLPRGTVLQASDVREAAWSTSVPKGALTKTGDVNGQTVIEPVQEGEPVTQAQLASAKSGTGAALGIPSGMRAVSVRTAESPGVAGLLRPGHRVDVQFLGQRPGVSNGEPELRTILQDVEVLAVNPQQEAAPRAGVVVATLLVKPAEADLVSLADAGSRLRLVLRNPQDHASASLNSVSVATLLRASTVVPPATVPPVNVALRPVTSVAPAVVRKDEESAQVVLGIQMVGLGRAALDAFGGVVRAGEDAVQVAPVPAGVDVAELARRWSGDRQWEVLSASRLATTSSREVSVQAGAPAGGVESVKVRLRPTVLASVIRLRVQPEWTAAPRRVSSEVEVSAGQSVLITGFPNVPAAPLIDQLFPLSAGGQRQQQLVVVVTPKVVRTVRPAVLVQGE